MKLVLRRSFWYHFSAKPEVFFYVMEGKTLAGREKRAEGEAAGRKLVFSFFERVPESVLVRRVHREGAGLVPHLLTLAELLATVGLNDLPPDRLMTSAATELLLEAKYTSLDITSYGGTLAPGPDPHNHQPEEGQCA